MTARGVLRVALAAVAAADAVTGLTALLTPRSFYELVVLAVPRAVAHD